MFNQHYRSTVLHIFTQRNLTLVLLEPYIEKFTAGPHLLYGSEREQPSVDGAGHTVSVESFLGTFAIPKMSL